MTENPPASAGGNYLNIVAICVDILERIICEIHG